MGKETFIADLLIGKYFTPILNKDNQLRCSSSNTMKGLTWQSLRANYSLIPLFSVVTLGMAMAAGHAVRCLAYSPDVKVNRRSLENPWDFTVNDDGSFKHAKYVKINDYRQLKKSDYEPALEE